MRLYVTPKAPNPRRVLWLMAEKGISDIDIVSVDILKGEHKIHPEIAKGGGYNLPVLDCENGHFIGESIAICRYLESLYPEPTLFGRTGQDIANIEVALRRAELYLANPLMLAARLSHPALAVLEEANEAVAAYNISQANTYAKVLDRLLENRAYLAGEAFSMADIVAACSFDFVRLIRYKPDEGLINLNRWLNEVRDRPAALSSK